MPVNIALNVYSLIILFFIYVNGRKHIDHTQIQDKLYLALLWITAFLLVVDLFSRFDGRPGTFYPYVNFWGNLLIYMLSPVLPALWFLYAYYQIFRDMARGKRVWWVLAAICGVNGILSLLSLRYAWFYTIDSGNIYHRGPLFLLPAFLTIGIIVAAFVMLLMNRKRIEPRYYFSLVFFAVPPFICVLLQIFFYGISFMLNSVVISLLIVFFNIQNQNLYIDYLTGTNNRKKLDYYMKARIAASTETKTFSAVLMDIDNFKEINDTYGHDTGDKALNIFINLLYSCLRSHDFIARFGGDEFYLILDSSTKDQLERIIERIQNRLAEFNEKGETPYPLSVSMGYAVYDYHRHLKVEEFQKEVDMLMYQNKHMHKCAIKSE
ncbi:MAG: GGDEF domain-containing protein [Clostridiaceae bacterium]|nr:GGDEF domain-containing protein [Clostridiaceae bacterium]